jgi:hypothetical protein
MHPGSLLRCRFLLAAPTDRLAVETVRERTRLSRRQSVSGLPDSPAAAIMGITCTILAA